MVWTISGIVLASCGGGGGGGGVTVSGLPVPDRPPPVPDPDPDPPVIEPYIARVVDGPVKGAAVYFDLDGRGWVSARERADQREDGRPKYETDENGEVEAPGQYKGLAFVADVNGAIDTATGEVLTGEYFSLGGSDIVTPITNLVVSAAGDGREQIVLNELFGLTDLITPLDILNIENYQIQANPQRSLPLQSDPQKMSSYKAWLIMRASLGLSEIDKGDPFAHLDTPQERIDILEAIFTGTAHGDKDELELRITAREAAGRDILGGKPYAVSTPVASKNTDGAFSLNNRNLEALFGFNDPNGNSESDVTSGFKGIYVKPAADFDRTGATDGTVPLLFDGRALNSDQGTRPTGTSAPPDTAGVHYYVSYENLHRLSIQHSSNDLGAIELDYFVFDGVDWSDKATLEITVNDGSAEFTIISSGDPNNPQPGDVLTATQIFPDPDRINTESSYPEYNYQWYYADAALIDLSDVQGREIQGPDHDIPSQFTGKDETYTIRSTDVGTTIGVRIAYDEDYEDNGLFLKPDAEIIRVELPAETVTNLPTTTSMTVLLQTGAVSSNPSDFSLEIYENHPLYKPLEIRPEGFRGYQLTEGYGDNAFFSINSGGEIRWKVIPDYETPRDGDGNNRYGIELSRTVDGHTERMTTEIIVNDLGLGEDSGDDYEPTVLFEPRDIPDEHMPSELGQHLITGYAWKMPKTGPLIMTYSISEVARADFEIYASDYYRDASDQEKIRLIFSTEDERIELVKTISTDQEKVNDRYNILEEGLKSFEKNVNIKFVEVAIGEKNVPHVDWLFSDILNVATHIADGADIQIDPLGHDGTYASFQRVVVHELGHALGLSHPQDTQGYSLPVASLLVDSLTPDPLLYWPGLSDGLYNDAIPLSVMASNYDVNALQQVDIEVLQFLYGAPGTDFEGVESLINGQASLTPSRSSGEVQTSLQSKVEIILEIDEGESLIANLDQYGLTNPVIEGDDSEDVVIKHTQGCSCSCCRGLELEFVSTPDFESPIDRDGNNVYEFTILDGLSTFEFNVTIVDLPDI
ncbi:MAG: hypothetical protein V6Z81_09560 [Parvularculales bacterium]